MCNPSGHPLTYEVGSCGDEVLFDVLEFSVCDTLHAKGAIFLCLTNSDILQTLLLSPSVTDPPAGSSSLTNDSTLNPTVLEGISILHHSCSLVNLRAPQPKSATWIRCQSSLAWYVTLYLLVNIH